MGTTSGGGTSGKDAPDDVKEVTRELRRFAWLVTQLTRDYGLSQAEISRRTGIDQSYLNKLANYEKYGYVRLSADIVRSVRDGIKVSPDYFYDDYDGEVAALPVYSLDAARKKAREREVDDRLGALEQQLREMHSLMLDTQKALIAKDSEIASLKRELANRPPIRTRRTT